MMLLLLLNILLLVMGCVGWTDAAEPASSIGHGRGRGGGSHRSFAALKAIQMGGDVVDDVVGNEASDDAFLVFGFETNELQRPLHSG